MSPMAMLMKYKLFVIFGALMVVEGVVFFLFLGGSGASASVVQEGLDDEAAETGEFVEFDLGEYKVSNNTIEGSPMRIDCKIFAEVPKEFEMEVSEVFETKKHRIRDAVQAVIRASEYKDITDPDLGAVKRKLKKSVADVIGSEKPYIAQIIVSDFQSYEL